MSFFFFGIILRNWIINAKNGLKAYLKVKKTISSGSTFSQKKTELVNEIYFLYNNLQNSLSFFMGFFLPKMRKFSLFILAYFLKAIPELEASSSKIQQAHQYYDATLYDEAASLYQNIIESIQQKEIEANPQEEDFLILRLAQSHFFKKNYVEAIALLLERFLKNPYEQNSSLDTYQEALYTLGLAYKRAGENNSSINAFQLYLKLGQPHELHFFTAAHYELGLAYFEQNKLALSKQHLEIIQVDPLTGIYERAQLFLAKIEKLEGRLNHAIEILSGLESRLELNDPLQFELFYLRGELSYLLQDYISAASFLEKALPQKNREQAPWCKETLYLLGWSYLKMATAASDMQLSNFAKAENAFTKIFLEWPEERFYLALGQFFLTKGKILKDPQSLSKVNELLGQVDLFKALDNQAYALLLRAEAATDYPERDALYRLLTQKIYKETSWYAQGWYFRGLNDYEHGQILLEQKKDSEAKVCFSQSIVSFQQAFECLKHKDTQLAKQALKYQIEASCTQEAYLRAFQTLDSWITEKNGILDVMDQADEIYYLHGLMASYLAKTEENGKFAALATASLQTGLTLFPQGAYAVKSLFLLGTVQFHHKKFEEAEDSFLKLTQIFPNSDLIAEALFFAAKSAEMRLSGFEYAQRYRKIIYEQFPHSLFAAEAYFFYYPYREYLQGDRMAVKHLQEMKEKFPNSPYTIIALYLTGVNYKKDRKSAEGKWISKKNLIEAIESFQEAESAFDRLYMLQAIPQEELRYYAKIRYQAFLERALANMAIADESYGAKRQIFLEYAVETLDLLIQDFKDADHVLTKYLCHMEPYPHIWEESSYWLAQAFAKLQEDAKAAKILAEMLEKYHCAKITKGYVLSRVWYELGLIAMRSGKFAEALQYLNNAEDTSKGKLLSTDQKIDLWIQQSLCYREMGSTDQAMILLSKAINDDAISSLRVKAMYIRAEIYSAQGRHELACKQLQATSKKGGEWALKAKQRLDKEYGYQ